MKDAILQILKKVIGEEVPVELSIPEEHSFGHYSTNVAMRLAKARGKAPLDLARELAGEVLQNAPADFFEKVEGVAPGFVNFWLSKKTLRAELEKISADEDFGKSQSLQGKTVMVEFTDPNPFKLFHIGHLMSNTIGEATARLYESAAAKVIRANYQGDVGLHVAKAVWGMMHLVEQHSGEKMPSEADPLVTKMDFLGKAYAFGAQIYEGKFYTPRPEAKDEMLAINEKIYSRGDEAVNHLYDLGRKWSLEYFETVYARLGTKFDNYFFENEMGKEGVDIVLSHKDIFKESEGAIIFPGEEYGLHTRVFINSKGLPTYEAKELGLNKKKFELYPLDLSVIVTGNEIVDYFRVLLKAMELILPDVAAKTRHTPHGMLRLPSGKMSSRTGDVVLAEALLDFAKAKVMERVKDAEGMSAEEKEAVAEGVAVGAIKYSILKQHPGQDIIFDFEKSLSFDGDSGPYIQYAYARLKSILRKAQVGDPKLQTEGSGLLESEAELGLVCRMIEFPNVISRAMELRAPSGLVTYLYKLAVAANRFYETTPILKDENASRRDARLALASISARTLRAGLHLLGIKTLEKI